MQKLDKPIELEGRVIRYKSIAKLKKKSRKMKGGVEILGEGQEGIVLRPNINQSPNNKTTVSKLITATREQADKLIAFEEKLNRIDNDGEYHVKMLSYRQITPDQINEIPNINQARKNEMKKYNFKITYQYGGISIEHFLDHFKEYSKYVDPHFIQSLLRGIVNCFQGLYVFYDVDIVHSDLHNGNIVFLLDDPKIMRMIDWGNLLVDNNSNFGPSSAPNSFRNSNFIGLSNSAPSSAPNFHHNSSSNFDSNSIKIYKKMKESLYRFYEAIRELLNKLKFEYKQNKKLAELLNSFLNIPNFFIYKTRSTAKILSREELDGVRGKMEEIIGKI